MLYALCGEYPERKDFKKKLNADIVQYNDSSSLLEVLNESGWNVERLYTLEHSEPVLNQLIASSKSNCKIEFE